MIGETDPWPDRVQLSPEERQSIEDFADLGVDVLTDLGIHPDSDAWIERGEFTFNFAIDDDLAEPIGSLLVDLSRLVRLALAISEQHWDERPSETVVLTPFVDGPRLTGAEEGSWSLKLSLGRDVTSRAASGEDAPEIDSPARRGSPEDPAIEVERLRVRAGNLARFTAMLALLTAAANAAGVVAPIVEQHTAGHPDVVIGCPDLPSVAEAFKDVARHDVAFEFAMTCTNREGQEVMVRTRVGPIIERED